MVGLKQRPKTAAMRVILIKINTMGLIGLFIALLSLHAGLCFAGSYTDSAHGSATYGVKRSSLSEYARGNCGHCHLQHGSLGDSLAGPFPFALFAENFNTIAETAPYNDSDNDNICFLCHGPSSLQQGGITNYDYSKTFGGDSTSNVSSILEVFNLKKSNLSASYHNLKDIYDFALTQNWPFFKEKSNPCVACHNPHLAKLIRINQTNPAAYTAVSLPIVKNIGNSQENHETLWGDGPGETMNDFYPNHYQAPLYYGSQNTYEPGGTSDYKGTKLPDYATFCTACHNSSNVIYSSELGRTLRKIDWYTIGGDTVNTDPLPDKHGKNSATVKVNLREPYENTLLGINIDFVTSCTDCHEPHGSPRPFLLRTVVNGKIIPSFNIDDNSLGYFCMACHKDDKALGRATQENVWEYVHHYDEDAPYPKKHGDQGRCGWCHGQHNRPIACIKCHQHGMKDTWAPDTEESGRICF